MYNSKQCVFKIHPLKLPSIMNSDKKLISTDTDNALALKKKKKTLHKCSDFSLKQENWLKPLTF